MASGRSFPLSLGSMESVLAEEQDFDLSFCFEILLSLFSPVPVLDPFAVWLWPVLHGQEMCPRTVDPQGPWNPNLCHAGWEGFTPKMAFSLGALGREEGQRNSSPGGVCCCVPTLPAQSCRHFAHVPKDTGWLLLVRLHRQ